MREYVIWGIPANGSEDTLLLASIQGEKIRSRANAEKWQQLLETKYGARNTRIQVIDLGKPLNWLAETGLTQ